MKKNYIQNILGGKFIAISVISMFCLMATGYWYSFTGDSELGEAQEGSMVQETNDVTAEEVNTDAVETQDPASQKKDKNKDKKKDKKKKYKSKKQTTKEINGYIIRNADTPHEYKVEKQKEGKRRRAEREPDLSSSTIYPVVSSAIKPGEKVQYVITLENKGNIAASDFDVFVEIDSSFSEPKNVKFSGCGKKKRKMDVEGAFGISNVTVKKNRACEIRFKVKPEVDGNFVNTLYISSAAEGGEEIGPIEAVAVTVRGEEIPTVEDQAEDQIEEQIQESLSTPEGEINESYNNDEEVAAEETTTPAPEGENEANPIFEGEETLPRAEEVTELPIEDSSETTEIQSDPQSDPQSEETITPTPESEESLPHNAEEESTEVSEEENVEI